jgi:hypothetical protein
MFLSLYCMGHNTRHYFHHNLRFQRSVHSTSFIHHGAHQSHHRARLRRVLWRRAHLARNILSPPLHPPAVSRARPLVPRANAAAMAVAMSALRGHGAADAREEPIEVVEAEGEESE